MSLCTCTRLGPARLLQKLKDDCPVHGNPPVCEGCDNPHHHCTDYNDCIMAHVPNSTCACPVQCMDNYEPTDEQLFALARRAPTGGYR